MNVRTMLTASALALWFLGRVYGVPLNDDRVREPNPSGDAYEFNDTDTEARDLQSYHQIIDRLSINPLGDEDWFRWRPNAAGSVTVSVTEDNGSLNLYLFKNKNPVGSGANPVTINVVPGDEMEIYVAAPGGTNPRYTLEIMGSAAGMLNHSPTATDRNESVSEAEERQIEEILELTSDQDNDPRTLELHSDWYGRARLDSSGDGIWYLPGTTITGEHPLTYVVHDGKGGRAKGTFDVSANAPGTLAFPDAQGFGAMASGGRGQPVRVVTTLDDDDVNPIPGSLREKLNLGPGIITFAVSGVIRPKSPLDIKSYVTIAGETAPGPDGITIYGGDFPVSDPPSASDGQNLATVGTAGTPRSHVIIRYLRFRHRDFDPNNQFKPPGANPQSDALTIHEESNNVIVDHCSLSWGGDGTMDIWESTDVTVQWCILAETLSPHSAGSNLINRIEGDKTTRVTFHHNLWAHNHSRNPNVVALDGTVHLDYVNNLIYNWGPPTTAHGEEGYGTRVEAKRMNSAAAFTANIVKNYFKSGPDTVIPGDWPEISQKCGPLCALKGAGTTVEIYWGRATPPPNANDQEWSNWLDKVGFPVGPLKPKLFGTPTEQFGAPFTWQEYNYVPVEQDSTSNAVYNNVLSFAGPSPWFDQDETDHRISNGVDTRLPQYGVITGDPDDDYLQ